MNVIDRSQRSSTAGRKASAARTRARTARNARILKLRQEGLSLAEVAEAIGGISRQGVAEAERSAIKASGAAGTIEQANIESRRVQAWFYRQRGRAVATFEMAWCEESEKAPPKNWYAGARQRKVDAIENQLSRALEQSAPDWNHVARLYSAIS